MGADSSAPIYFVIFFWQIRCLPVRFRTQTGIEPLRMAPIFSLIYSLHITYHYLLFAPSNFFTFYSNKRFNPTSSLNPLSISPSISSIIISPTPPITAEFKCPPKVL